MGSRIRSKRRFGMAGGKHTKCRKSKNDKKTYKCTQTSNTKLKLSRKLFKSKLKKKQFCVKVTDTYMLKRMSDSLKLVFKKLQPVNMNGYRMISLDCLQENMNSILKHCVVCVPARDAVLSGKQPVQLISEDKTYGLASEITVRCNACGHDMKFTTSKKLELTSSAHYDVNVRAVWGSIVTGNGAAHLREVMGTMDSPSLTQTSFTKIEQEIGDWWEKISEAELLEAGAEERRIAIEKGSYHQGVPAITVIADGGWSKRSHKHSYNALGGVGVIIGQETGKLLYVGIKNKNCYVCSTALTKHEQPKDHRCWKNWDMSSQAMEAEIILEGFSKAENTHGLRYMWLVGDGDSSVFARITQEVPIWGPHIQKIECANHMCKSLRSNLEKLVDANPAYKGKNRLTKVTRIRLVSAVRCAIRMRAKEDDKRVAALQLAKDIRNSVFHIFGIHTNCSDFCKAKEKVLDIPSTDIDTLGDPADLCSEVSSLWSEGSSIQAQELSRYGTLTIDLDDTIRQDVAVLLNRVASKSDRLIQNTTTNLAECWMRIRMKFDGGKVYNLCNRGSWHTRCYGGSLRQNLGPQWSPLVWRTVTCSPPGQHFVKLYEDRTKHLSQSNASKKKPVASVNRWKRKMASVKQNTSKVARQAYGPDALDSQPDLPVDQLYIKIKQFTAAHIDVSSDKVKSIELLTRDQSDNKVWFEERRKRLTASKFGSVLKRNPSLKVCKLVSSLLYSKFKGNIYTVNGLQQERSTIHEYILNQAELGINTVVNKCGLVISKTLKYLGASPDGVVTIDGKESGLVEIKNVLLNKQITLKEAARTQTGFCLGLQCGKLGLKHNHLYFYQCHGLMNVCELPWIDFVVRTVNPYEIYIERIERDTQLWNSWLPKLDAFYHKVLLPELASPRNGFLPGIREPGVWFQDKPKQKFVKCPKRARVVEQPHTTGTCTDSTQRKSTATPAKSTATPAKSTATPAKSSATPTKPTATHAKSTPTPSTLTQTPAKSTLTPNKSTQSQATSKPRRVAKTKLVGREIIHQWTLEEGNDKVQWYRGTVLSVVSGTDGTNTAIYEVLYEGEDEPYEVEHLVEDFNTSLAKFTDI